MTTTSTLGEAIAAVIAQLDGLGDDYQPARPERDRLAGLVPTRTVIGTTTTFETNAERVSTHLEYGRPEIVIYGTMTFRDRTDSAARLHIRQRGDETEGDYTFTKANAWNGYKWADLPAGAREKIAGAVRRHLGPIDWPALHAEIEQADRAANIRGKLADARRALRDAGELLAAKP